MSACVEVQLRLARGVVDRDGRLVLLRLLDVVDVDQVAEDLDGVGPAEADRRAGEPEAAGRSAGRRAR